MPTISLPGWRDIISIPHAPPPTPDEYREYRDAAKRQRPPNLTTDRIDEIERRRAIRSRIQESTTPQTARRFQNILTWLDDAQDMFAILTVAGRLAARAFPKILARLIPGLAWVLLAADILKLLTLLTSIIQPFFVALCDGWRRGLIGGLPPLLLGNAAKLIGHGITGLNPFSRAARLARQAKFAGRLLRAGELLELAQAMKTLTGYGLTLGGIMGTITEIGYAIEMLIRGQGVEIAVSGPTQTRIRLADGTTYHAARPHVLASTLEHVARTHADPTIKELAAYKARTLRAITGQ